MPGLLVIDDDRSVVHFLKAACKELHVTIHSAEDAEEGLTMIKRVQPDALLLDVMLPGMTGIELFQKVRRIDERIPVIFITAGGESDSAIEAMKLGALDFLLKPLDVERVRHLVSQSLEIRRLMETPVELPEPQAEGLDSQLIGRSPPMTRRASSTVRRAMSMTRSSSSRTGTERGRACATRVRPRSPSSAGSRATAWESGSKRSSTTRRISRGSSRNCRAARCARAP